MTNPGEGSPSESYMTETDPAIIDTQIAAGLTEKGTSGFLNNFRGNLPGGFLRELIERHDWLDSPAREDTSRITPRTSERIQTVTWHQFFGDVDQAIPDSGTSKEELDHLKAMYDSAQTTLEADSAVAYRDYTQAIIPVYRQLRIVGYSHEDLTV